MPLALPVSLVATIPPPPFRGEDGMTSLELGPVNIAMYGVLIAVGAYLGLVLLSHRYGAMGGDTELAERTALLAIAAAIVGARIGYIIPRWERFLANPLEIVQIWQGGLAFFGGVTLSVPVALWYARRKHASLPAMVDAAAPALPLGHAIGRWGNYFNQELFGRPSGLPWALEVEAHRIPRHVAERYPGAATFHPTFLYESLWNLALVGVLLWVDRRRGADGGRLLRRGSLGFLYLVGYGLGRFWTELLRVDTPERYLGLSRNNWIALLVVVVGVAGAAWWERRGRAGGDDDGPRRDAPAEEASETDGPSQDPPAEAVSEDDADARDGATGDGSPEDRDRET